MVVSSTVRRRPCVNSARRQARLLYASLSSLSSSSPTSLSSIDYHVNKNENNNSNNNNSNNNADPNEVNKFSSFASSWWDARSNPLVGMNPIRIQFIREVLLSNSTSLDDERMTPPSSRRRQQQQQRTLIGMPLLHGKTCLDI